MQTKNSVIHQTFKLKSSFEEFTVNIEKVLQRLAPDWSEKFESDPESLKDYLNDTAGSAGLMIFSDQQHGSLLALKGAPRKAVQYTIGNPLTALEMTFHDIRAALYAPVRILVYENEKTELNVEYDLPSSQFGQFGNEAFLVAKSVDSKLEAAILDADNFVR